MGISQLHWFLMEILEGVPPEWVVVGYFGQSTREIVGHEKSFSCCHQGVRAAPLGFAEWDALLSGNCGIRPTPNRLWRPEASIPCPKTDFDIDMRGGESGV